LDPNHLQRARLGGGNPALYLDTPFAINDRGRIVGGYLTAGPAEAIPGGHLVGLRADPVKLPGLPACGFGVNNSGQIVGHSDLLLPTVYGVGWSRR